MTEIDVPDRVVEVALKAWFSGEDYENADMSAFNEDMRATLTAALGAWVVPAPALHISERCETCGDVLHISVSSTSHLTLRQEKPE